MEIFRKMLDVVGKKAASSDYGQIVFLFEGPSFGGLQWFRGSRFSLFLSFSLLSW